MDTTFYSIQSAIRFFLSELLKSPMNARVPKYLKERGFDSKRLINCLLKRGVLERHEKIDDGIDGAKPRYSVTYKVRKKDFEKKIRRFYQTYFEHKEMDECTSCGSVGGGAVFMSDTGSGDSGSDGTSNGNGYEYDVPAFGGGVMRRTVAGGRKKKKKTNEGKAIFISEAQAKVLKKILKR